MLKDLFVVLFALGCLTLYTISFVFFLRAGLSSDVAYLINGLGFFLSGSILGFFGAALDAIK